MMAILKNLKITTKLAIGFTLGVVSLIVIGGKAIRVITEVKNNVAYLTICKNIEIEVLECRRQEKNILLFGPDEIARLEEREEKTYLEKINGHLDTLKKLIEKGNKNVIGADKEFKTALIELNNYTASLEKVKANFKEQKIIQQSVEDYFEKLRREFDQQQKRLPEVSLLILEIHLQIHHYLYFHNSEYLIGAKKKINILIKAIKDKEINTIINENMALIDSLIKNNNAIETHIINMREGGRKIQETASEIMGSIEKRINDIQKNNLSVMLMIIISTIILESGICFYFSQSIISPIHQLQSTSAIIAKGDLSQRVVINSNDEIGELGQSFNKMVDNLEIITVSKEYTDNIIGSMVDALVVVSPEGMIKTVNGALCQLLGYSEKDLVGASVRQIFEGEPFFIGTKVDKILKNGCFNNYEFTYLSKDKQKIPALLSGSVLRNGEGIITEIIALGKDMRELKKLQEKLNHSERLATMGKFASVISHEFRNYLGVMRNSVYIIKMKLNSSDENINKYLAILEEQIVEVDKAIENILTFAKTKQPKVKKVGLPAILFGCIDNVQIPNRIELITRIDQDLPMIQADEIQLSVVFINIIINALQSIKSEGKLVITAKKENDFVNISFRDTGCGVKKENRNKIFEPFYSTKDTGYGLGLSTAKIIIEAHGGRINVESEADEGTVVTINLPIS